MAWTSGQIVLLDRYTYSNIAYQCAKIHRRKLQDDLMNWILSLEFEHFAIPKPDLNIFLDVPFAFTEKKLSGSPVQVMTGYISTEQTIFMKRVWIFRKKSEKCTLRVAISRRQACCN